MVVESYHILVTTEYFLWVDDDFIIRSKTDLRFMLKVIQQTGYDVIGAGVSRSGESHWVRIIDEAWYKLYSNLIIKLMKFI